MAEERSRPNLVAQKKYEAIKYWDEHARANIQRDRPIRAFGDWVMMQLAKLHAESWAGMALDVFSLGSGGLLVKGVQKGAQLARGAEALRHARTMVEIDQALRPIRAAEGLTRPLATAGQRAAATVGAAAEILERTAPKWIEPLVVGGRKLVTPRRLVKAAGKLKTGAQTQAKLDTGFTGLPEPGVQHWPLIHPESGKPVRFAQTMPLHAPLSGQYHWVFPPEIVRRSRPAAAGQTAGAIDPWSRKPYRSAAGLSANAPLSSRYHWVFPAELITHSRPGVLRTMFERGMAGTQRHWWEQVPTGRRDPLPREVSRFPIEQRQPWLRAYYRANPAAAAQARTEARTIIDWAHRTLR